MQALVIKSTGSWYLVKTDDGKLLKCRIKGKFRIQGIKSTNPIVVGDRVILKKENEDYLIVKLNNRKNIVIRKSVNLAKQTHIIASNVDQVILMVTLKDPITTTGFIDRFLASAQAYKINVLIIFNKLDLYNNDLIDKHKRLDIIYRNIGYSCLSVSILNDNLDELRNTMKGKINVIAGHSGVGKTTLINKLQPTLELKTEEISESHNQGQHTTAFSELYQLDFGAEIIDTPGIKGFGLVKMNQSEIGDYFIEFFKLKSDCKYHNCIHKDEPNCAVKSALENGKIAKSRYINYLNILKEDEENYRINDF
tara:strand:- start:533 stop:1459 length:927 start_codon:yes stop_codon:yes gene_type:complete